MVDCERITNHSLDPRAMLTRTSRRLRVFTGKNIDPSRISPKMVQCVESVMSLYRQTKQPSYRTLGKNTELMAKENLGSGEPANCDPRLRAFFSGNTRLQDYYDMGPSLSLISFLLTSWHSQIRNATRLTRMTIVSHGILLFRLRQGYPPDVVPSITSAV